MAAVSKSREHRAEFFRKVRDARGDRFKVGEAHFETFNRLVVKRLAVQEDHRKCGACTTDKVDGLFRHALERQVLERFLDKLLVFRTGNRAHCLEHLECANGNRECRFAVAEFCGSATDVNRDVSFAVPFLDGAVGELAFFFAGDDARLDPHGFFNSFDHFVRICRLAHGFGHRDCLEVCAEGVQVHAELGHDVDEFLDAFGRDFAVFVNVFAESADFDLLKFRHENLARGGFVFFCGHFGRLSVLGADYFGGLEIRGFSGHFGRLRVLRADCFGW